MGQNEANKELAAERAAVITTALAAVDQAGVPEALREVAFGETLRSLYDEPGSVDVTVAEPVAIELSVAEQNTVHGRVSEQTGVPVADLEKVFSVEDGVIELLGQPSRFGSTHAVQAKTIAQIVTVVHALGLDLKETPVEILREACDSKYCYNERYFLRQLRELQGFTVKEERKNVLLVPQGAGLAAFPGIIEGIVG